MRGVVGRWSIGVELHPLHSDCAQSRGTRTAVSSRGQRGVGHRRLRTRLHVLLRRSSDQPGLVRAAVSLLRWCALVRRRTRVRPLQRELNRAVPRVVRPPPAKLSVGARLLDRRRATARVPPGVGRWTAPAELPLRLHQRLPAGPRVCTGCDTARMPSGIGRLLLVLLRPRRADGLPLRPAVHPHRSRGG